MKQDSPQVSIIIPVYNTSKYIDYCIESILNQTYSNLEIIIVDDGSTDDSYVKCMSFAKKDSRIKVIQQKNQGVSVARNTALDNSNGDYICCVDSDDFVASDYVEVLLELCIKNKTKCAQIGYKYVPYDCFDIDVHEEKRCMDVTVWRFRDLFCGHERKYRAIVCGKIFAKELFDNYRFPVGRVFEDEEAAFKLLYQAKKITILNRTMYYYRMSNNSIMRNKKETNFDFVILHQGIIEMLEMKNEQALLIFERKEFCIRLMMAYINSIKKKEKQETQNRLYEYFRENYKRIKSKSQFCKRERYALFAFNLCPHIFSYIECKFNFIKKNKIKRVNKKCKY